MPKKIIVTRSNHQAQAFASSVVNRLGGISMNDFVFEPMTEIVHFPFDITRLQDYDGIIMTSLNAAVSLELNAPTRHMLADKPFYCVGDHTKQKLLSIGATNVVLCARTPDLLAEEMLTGEEGSLCVGKRFLYMRGRDVALEIGKVLKSGTKGKGRFAVTVDEAVCYEAKPVSRFSPNIKESLLPEEVGLIVFFSVRTAEAFARLWAQELGKEEAYVEALKGVKALCIDEKIAKCVQSVFGKDDCVVVETPDLTSMIDEIERKV
jgi:uroporphyrinogen-III synthase